MTSSRGMKRDGLPDVGWDWMRDGRVSNHGWLTRALPHLIGRVATIHLDGGGIARGVITDVSKWDLTIGTYSPIGPFMVVPLSGILRFKLREATT